MKKRMMTLGLAVALTSPLALSQMALAQVTPAPVIQSEGQVARFSEDQMWDAFFTSGYNYWDAKILADFWGSSVSDAKTAIGNKMLQGGQTKALLRLVMTDARVKALPRANELNYYFDAGYDYDDAVKLSKFWGGDDIYQTKIRIERNIIMGNMADIDYLLERGD